MSQCLCWHTTDCQVKQGIRPDTPSALSFAFDKRVHLCNAQQVSNLGLQPLLRLISLLPGCLAWAGLHLAMMGKPKFIPFPSKQRANFTPDEAALLFQAARNLLLMAWLGGSPSTTRVTHTGGSPTSLQSHTPSWTRPLSCSSTDVSGAVRKTALAAESLNTREHRWSSMGWSDAKQKEALKRPEHLPGEGRHHQVLHRKEIRNRGKKQVTPTDSGEMLLQEAGGEDKRAAETTCWGGWGKVPLPQHVVSCRGSQSGQVFSSFQAGMPQETAPHAPQDKRAVLCVNKRHCCAARQAVNQSYLIQFPPQSN